MDGSFGSLGSRSRGDVGLSFHESSANCVGEKIDAVHDHAQRTATIEQDDRSHSANSSKLVQHNPCLCHAGAGSICKTDLGSTLV